MTEVFDCFKAYDVRGRIPDQLNEDIARRIGKAYAEVIQPGTVVVGHDIRLTSESIKGALVEGLLEQGVSVQDWPVRHGRNLLRDGAPWCRGRHRRYRQPQPERLQRHEVRP